MMASIEQLLTPDL